MYAIEDTINQYLKTMGVTVTKPFADLQGTNPVIRFTVASHLNVNLGIFLDNQFMSLGINYGYLPKQNVAPLLRRLLNLNSKMGGPYFSIGDLGAISLTMIRKQEGLDFAELKWMIDQMCGMFWQFTAGLIQEFQIPQQPV